MDVSEFCLVWELTSSRPIVIPFAVISSWIICLVSCVGIIKVVYKLLYAAAQSKRLRVKSASTSSIIFGSLDLLTFIGSTPIVPIDIIESSVAFLPWGHCDAAGKAPAAVFGPSTGRSSGCNQYFAKALTIFEPAQQVKFIQVFLSSSFIDAGVNFLPENFNNHSPFSSL